MSVSKIRSRVGCGKSDWSEGGGMWFVETVSVDSVEGKTRGYWKKESEEE